MAESSPVQYIVRLYSSTAAIGFNILRVNNGEEQIVNSGHKLLSQAQSTRSCLERELAALKFAFDSNSTLLSENDYIIETDFLPLRSLFACALPQQ